MPLTPRVKKYTDYNYLKTNPADENAVRSQMDGAVDEVFTTVDNEVAKLSGGNAFTGVQTFDGNAPMVTSLYLSGTDLNAIFLAGSHRLQDFFSNAPSADWSAGWDYSQLIVATGSVVDTASQIIISSRDGAMAVRSFFAGSWGAWNRIIDNKQTTTIITTGFASGWNGSVTVRKGLGNLVQVVGDLSKNVDIGGVQTVLTLPIGVRPMNSLVNTTTLFSGGTPIVGNFSFVDISTTGTIEVSSNGATANARRVLFNFTYYSA